MVSSFSFSKPQRKQQQQQMRKKQQQQQISKFSWNVTSIPRISVNNFDPYRDYYHHHEYMERPILITNVLSKKCAEALAEEIVMAASKKNVIVQRQQRRQQQRQRQKNPQRRGSSAAAAEMKTTEMYECSFEEALEEMMDSSWEDAAFCFSEGLLSSSSSSSKEDDLTSHLCQIREDLFRSKNKNNKGVVDADDDEDWFQYFPIKARPLDCIILAGEGATSTLHRDPMEWTGTSLCLEGSKLWRFIPPPPSTSDCNINQVELVDKALNSYRLASIAWETDNDNDDEDNDHHNDEQDQISLPLSAGWQSDYSLFETMHQNSEESSDHDHGRLLPSSRSLAQMEEEEELMLSSSSFSSSSQIKSHVSKKFQLLTRACSNVHWFYPSPEILSNLVQTTQQHKEQQQQQQKSQTQQQQQQQQPMWTAVQCPGDLLIIPAYWWHQTYAPEPSLAVASQRCSGSSRSKNHGDAPRVLQHIMNTVRQHLAQQKEDEKEEEDAEKRNVVEEEEDIVSSLLFENSNNGHLVVSRFFDYLKTIL